MRLLSDVQALSQIHGQTANKGIPSSTEVSTQNYSSSYWSIICYPGQEFCLARGVW